MVEESMVKIIAKLMSIVEVVSQKRELTRDQLYQ